MTLDQRTIVCDYCGSRNDIPCIYYNVRIVNAEKDMCCDCYKTYSSKVVENYCNKVLKPNYCEYSGEFVKQVVNCIVDKVAMSNSGPVTELHTLEFKINRDLI